MPAEARPGLRESGSEALHSGLHGGRGRADFDVRPRRGNELSCSQFDEIGGNLKVGPEPGERGEGLVHHRQSQAAFFQGLPDPLGKRQLQQMWSAEEVDEVAQLVDHVARADSIFGQSALDFPAGPCLVPWLEAGEEFARTMDLRAGFRPGGKPIGLGEKTVDYDVRRAPEAPVPGTDVPKGATHGTQVRRVAAHLPGVELTAHPAPEPHPLASGHGACPPRHFGAANILLLDHAVS